LTGDGGGVEEGEEDVEIAEDLHNRWVTGAGEVGEGGRSRWMVRCSERMT